MRIVQICHRYYPTVGGIQTCVKEVSERLVKEGFEVVVVTTDPSGKLPREEIVNDVRIRRVKSWAPSGAYYLPHPNMLPHLLAEWQDIIHVHGVHALTTFMAYIAHNLRRKPKFIVSPYFHGRGHTKLAQVLWVPYRPIVKKILGVADGVLVNSRAERDLIKRSFNPSSEIFLVYDGINVNEIENAQPFTFDESCRILLYVGRLVKYKNIHATIASMKYLPENYHFYIIGRGPFRPFLEALVESLGLQSRVHFLGFQPNNTVHRWLKTAHVFVHLSDAESFGMTCIESLAAGTPVIANNDGLGLNETIDLFPEYIRMFRARKEPVSKLARLIIEVAELKPITTDVQQFSWDSIAESVSTVYKQILMEQ